MDNDEMKAMPNQGAGAVDFQLPATSPGRSDTDGHDAQTEDSGKVRVRFKAVGNAPIMKRKKYFISSKEKVSVLSTFLRKQLKLEPGASLFLFCNSLFAPSLDQEVGELHECFKEKTTNELIVDYSLTWAYG